MNHGLGSPTNPIKIKLGESGCSLKAVLIKT